jgi:hypothetical protein
VKNKLEALIARFRALSVARRWLVVMAFIGGLLILPQFTEMLSNRNSEWRQRENEITGAAAQTQIVDEEDQRKDLPDQLSAAKESKERMQRAVGAGIPYSNPLIAHTALLAVATKEFAKSRTSLEEILERH